MAEKEKEKNRRICYYELLGLDRKCEANEVKTAYRKLALKMHPDKAAQNDLSVEDATRRFQQIQEAYSTLSDAQERAWYDAHREQILKGDDEPGEDPFKTRINLYKYFASGCYDGFGDGAGGFYAVYGDLFQAIDQEEEEWEDADEDHKAMPPFGDSKSEWVDVANFYRQWLDFCSRKAFGHADKWNPREAPNRPTRRAMEQENKKARQTAKKEFNAEVRQLVARVQKRDPRVEAFKKQQMKEAVEKTAREQAEKEQRKVTDAQERKERKEAARQAQEERWAELEAARQARRASGEDVSADENSDSSADVVSYYCEACRKSFKSEKQLDSHMRSKKHLQCVEKLRKDLEREIAEEQRHRRSAAEANGDAASSEEEVSSASSTADAPASKEAGAAEAAEAAQKEEDSDEEEDEDAYLARFAAARQQRGGGGGARGPFSPPPRTGESEGSDAEQGGGDDAEEDSAAAGLEGGKQAQKRAMQKALLLQQQAVRAEAEAARKAEAEAGEAEAEDAPEAAEEVEKDGADEAAVCPKKKPGRRRAAPPVTAEVPRCAVCSKEFPSRSKLFQHLKDSGHAAPKKMNTAQR